MRRTGWLAGGYVLSATGCALATLTSRAAFGDLSIYAAGGAAVLHGTPLYQLRFAFGLRFTYPPFAALLFAPLTWLPAIAGQVLVSAATVLALPVTSYLVLRLPPWPAQLSRDRAAQLALAFSAAAIWLEPERTNLKYGQINVFLTTLVLLDLAWIERGRNRGLGGALIGIAAGIKLTPAVFAVYLLATRRYRAAATAAAAFAGTVAIAFALVPGDAARYWDLSFLDPGHVGRIQNVANQSLLGALARVLGTLSVGSVWLPVAAMVGGGGNRARGPGRPGGPGGAGVRAVRGDQPARLADLVVASLGARRAGVAGGRGDRGQAVAEQIRGGRTGRAGGRRGSRVGRDHLAGAARRRPLRRAEPDPGAAHRRGRLRAGRVGRRRIGPGAGGQPGVDLGLPPALFAAIGEAGVERVAGQPGQRRVVEGERARTAARLSSTYPPK